MEEKSGRRGRHRPRPPTPPDVLRVSGDFLPLVQRLILVAKVHQTAVLEPSLIHGLLCGWAARQPPPALPRACEPPGRPFRDTFCRKNSAIALVRWHHHGPQR